MAQPHRAVKPIASSVGTSVADDIGHAPEEGRVSWAVIEKISSCDPAHQASEAKQNGKAPDCLWMVTYYPPPQLDPGVAVKGSGLFADADQQFRRFPSRLEQPEYEERPSKAAPMTMRDPRGNVSKADEVRNFIAAMVHRKAPQPPVPRASSHEARQVR